MVALVGVGSSRLRNALGLGSLGLMTLAVGCAKPPPVWSRPAPGTSPPAGAIASVADEGTLPRLWAGDWERVGPSLWRRALVPGIAGAQVQSRTLRSGDLSVDELAPGAEPGPDGGFVVLDEHLELRGWTQGEPSDELRLVESVQRGSGALSARWATVGEVGARGWDLWPGEAIELESAIAPRSVLRFVSAHASPKQGSEGRPLVFKLAIDGSEVKRWEERSLPKVALRSHEIDLDEWTGERRRMRFSVEGSESAGAILNPILGPRDIGSYDDRPWPEERRDVVLFLADTFRADNLAVYGGDPGGMPVLNRWSEGCVRFLQARSPSTWTLPAHASLFTGLFPTQHGVLDKNLALAADYQTVAEHFARLGYRTGAITDGVFLSQRHGLHQGFEWFLEAAEWDLQRTLDEIERFLDQDDGRPTFLFVHSYRTHGPYRVGPDESEEEFQDVRRRANARLRQARRGPIRDRLGELLAEYLEVYRRGSRGLDTGFGRMLTLFDECGFLRRGALVFTSDHGEAFYEHGFKGHGNLPFEELIRVPLLVWSSDHAARDVTVDASLVDVPRTLAALARVAPASEWGGQSLLDPLGERSVYAYSPEKGGTRWAAISEGRKLIFEPGAAPTDAVLEAFELATDPLEETSVASEAWIDDLLLRWSEERSELGTCRFPASQTQHDEQAVQRLRALGYADD